MVTLAMALRSGRHGHVVQEQEGKLLVTITTSFGAIEVGEVEVGDDGAVTIVSSAEQYRDRLANLCGV